MDLSSSLILASSFLTFTSIYIILALSTNLEYGYTGIPNFGKVFYYFVGAIVSSIVASSLYNTALGIADGFTAEAASKRTAYSASNPVFAIEVFLVSLAASAIVSGIIGYLSSYPALALKEDFLAITLLVFGEAARIFVRTYEPLVGGVYGMSGIPNPLNWIPDRAIALTIYSLILVAAAIATFILVERLANSPFGRVMKAVRDDEIASSSLGKNVARVRGAVLFISSSLAGVAGCLYTFYSQSIFPDDYVPPVTFFVISMMLLGGAGNNVGTIIGAVILSIFERLTQASTLALFGILPPFDISFLRYASTGALIILVLLFRPQGILREGVVKTPLYRVLSRKLGYEDNRGWSSEKNRSRG